MNCRWNNQPVYVRCSSWHTNTMTQHCSVESLLTLILNHYQHLSTIYDHPPRAPGSAPRRPTLCQRGESMRRPCPKNCWRSSRRECLGSSLGSHRCMSWVLNYAGRISIWNSWTRNKWSAILISNPNQRHENIVTPSTVRDGTHQRHYPWDGESHWRMGRSSTKNRWIADQESREDIDHHQHSSTIG